MSDRDDDRERNPASDLLPFDIPAGMDGSLPGQDALAEVADELGAMLDGARPDPDDIEAALDGIDLPDAGTLDVETDVLPEAVAVDPGDADVVLDTGGDVVDATVAQSGEAVEIAVDQSGEAAAEVVVEVVAAVLDGA